MLVIDQSECIEDRPVPGPFPDFPMTKREKPWERGWQIRLLKFVYATYREKFQTSIFSVLGRNLKMPTAKF
jgi:hypothetical protein